MRLATLVLTATTGVLPLTGAALAQPAPSAPPASMPSTDAPMRRPAAHAFQDKFAAANTTHDGRLTLAQAQAGGLHRVSRNFDAIDTGHAGYVTLAEIRAFNRARRTAHSGNTPG